MKIARTGLAVLVLAATTALAHDDQASPIGLIPEPCHGSCLVDWDDGTFTGTPDGGGTIDDLFYYLHIFAEGHPCADVDDGSFTGIRDGAVTIEDFLFLWMWDRCC